MRPNMFPPSREVLDALHIERWWIFWNAYVKLEFSIIFSIRLLPHHQDTGAFFVALFRKIDSSSLLTEEELSQKRPIEENTFNEEG
jgi:hypothetical protein